mmetsp:Transcript_13722/g.54284  ORF Transcript_13722/g.54284 Transcript_13722/m.54284 type:complete len:288 (+) Transcript_13722:1322-2185(+)
MRGLGRAVAEARQAEGAPLRVRVRLRDQRRERRNVADARVRRAVTSQGVGMRRAGCFGERDVRSAHGERVRLRRGDSAARGHAQRVWAHDFVGVARGARGDGVSAARGRGEGTEVEEGDIDASAVAAGSARRGEVQVVALHTASQAGRDCRRGRMRDAGGEEGELHVSAQEGGRVRVRVAGSLRQQGGCRTAVEGQGRARVGFVTVVGIAIHQTSLCPLITKSYVLSVLHQTSLGNVGSQSFFHFAIPPMRSVVLNPFDRSHDAASCESFPLEHTQTMTHSLSFFFV